MNAPPLSDAELVRYARQAGFSGEALVTMVAVALAESGGDPDILGDQGLTSSKWGPSIGLAQIRSLWADLGTGRARDPKALTNPAFNMRSAFSISSGGTNFRPWTMWTNGRYRQFLDRARRAVAGAGGGAGGMQGIQGLGGGIAGDIVERVATPLLGGLSRIALTGVLLIGGVALIAAGGWKAVAPARQRAADRAGDRLAMIPHPAAQAGAAAAKSGA